MKCLLFNLHWCIIFTVQCWTIHELIIVQPALVNYFYCAVLNYSGIDYCSTCISVFFLLCSVELFMNCSLFNLHRWIIFTVQCWTIHEWTRSLRDSGQNYCRPQKDGAVQPSISKNKNADKTQRTSQPTAKKKKVFINKRRKKW